MSNKIILKRNTHKFLLFMIVGGILLSSCAGQATSEPTLDPNRIQTSAIQTFMVALTQTQAAQPTATETLSAPPTETALSLPTIPTLDASTPTAYPLLLPTTYILPTATGTQYTPTANPLVSAVGCNNLRLVLDVNIPSGTVFQPNEHFTKTWKVENNGTCDWVYQYALTFVGGERMGGDPGYLAKTIVPGKWTEFSVNMRAPKDPGTYTGNWRMATQAGTLFGATLTVSIVVANPTNTPKPTATNTPTYP